MTADASCAFVICAGCPGMLHKPAVALPSPCGLTRQRNGGRSSRRRSSTRSSATCLRLPAARAASAWQTCAPARSPTAPCARTRRCAGFLWVGLGPPAGQRALLLAARHAMLLAARCAQVLGLVGRQPWKNRVLAAQAAVSYQVCLLHHLLQACLCGLTGGQSCTARSAVQYRPRLT